MGGKVQKVMVNKGSESRRGDVNGSERKVGKEQYGE